MSPEWIAALVLFGIFHWVLAIMLLNDMTRREKEKGGRKVFWVIAIIFITLLGSMLYLLFHPSYFFDSNDEDEF